MGATTEQAKLIASGFLAAASIIWLLASFGWLHFGYLSPWVGVPVFLFLAVAFSAYFYLLIKGFSQKTPVQMRVKQAKNLLMALIGVGLACWFFDVLSTVFVINVAEAGIELNLLGWPFSAPAALAYYVPIALITYYLLFTIKKRATFYGAVVISALTLFMATRSFFAAMNNWAGGIFPSSPEADLLIAIIWCALAIVLGALNLILLTASKKKRAFGFSV